MNYFRFNFILALFFFHCQFTSSGPLEEHKEMILNILCALKNNNQEAIGKYDEGEVKAAREIYTALDGDSPTASLSFSSDTISLNGTEINVNGRNASFINGYFYTDDNKYKVNPPLKLIINSGVSSIYASNTKITCDTVEKAVINNGSIDCQNINGDTIVNNGNIKVTGDIHGHPLVNNGSIMKK